MHFTSPLPKRRISKDELQVLQVVSSAMYMSAAEFLTEEVYGTSTEEARAYLKGFVGHANDGQIRTMYYLTRALTEKGR